MVKEILGRIKRIMAILLFVSIILSATVAAVSACSDEDKDSHEGGHHYGGQAYDERYEEGCYHYGGHVCDERCEEGGYHYDGHVCDERCKEGSYQHSSLKKSTEYSSLTYINAVKYSSSSSSSIYSSDDSDEEYEE